MFACTVGHEITSEEAMTHAKDLEKQIGEVIDGKRKATQLKVENMVFLIAYCRQIQENK